MNAGVRAKVGGLSRLVVANKERRSRVCFRARAAWTSIYLIRDLAASALAHHGSNLFLEQPQGLDSGKIHMREI